MGQAITCDRDKGIKIEQVPEPPADNNVITETEEFYAAELPRLMEKAIKKAIDYKHPDYLSVSLSGGVDSSLVAALFKKSADYKIKTNTIACEGWEEDLPYARQVAQYLDTKHEELMLSAKEVVETLVKVTGEMDLPTANLRLFIRKYHDDNPDVVLLGGFGADELFLGWPQYQRMLQPDNYDRNAFLPGIIRQRITRNVEPFLTNHLFLPEEKRMLFTEEAWDKIKNYLSGYPLRPHAEYHTPEEGVKLIQKFHLRHRMANWQLMWAGFDNIYPYLEEEFVDFAVKIPVRCNIKTGTEKYMLRKAAQGWLPDEISNRADSHSSLPLARWFEAGLKDKAIELLKDSCLVEAKIFNRKYIEGLLKTFDNSMLVKIYHIALLEIWFRNHL
jgi:asparagine synthase (glutamine-hydrolysing)